MITSVEKSRKELFDREYEFNKITSAIRDGVLLAVTWAKTTPVKVLLNKIDNPCVYIDARKLWSVHANIYHQTLLK